MKRIAVTKNTILLAIANNTQGEQVFKTIIHHPMENGLRRYPRSDKNIPADYIKDFQVRLGDETVFEMMMGPEVSKNPFVAFAFANPVSDEQKLQVSWVENNGAQTSYDFIVKFGPDKIYRDKGKSQATTVYYEVPEFKPAPRPYCRTQSAGAKQ